MKRRKPGVAGGARWIDELSALSGPPKTDEHDEPLPCPRCGQVTPTGDLRLWNERLRLRTFSDGAFKYVYKDRYFAVCQECYAKLSRGASLADMHERRGIIILIVAILLAIAAAAVTPYVLPTLASALWQTH